MYERLVPSRNERRSANLHWQHPLAAGSPGWLARQLSAPHLSNTGAQLITHPLTHDSHIHRLHYTTVYSDTSSSRLEFNGVINRGGEKEWGQSRAVPINPENS
ncbi:hypothetical protein J6590_005408 [Homalodisca vitripennis]|nr:hypothetical protein J6590_005408 [Homalodisca vitripennis]